VVERIGLRQGLSQGTVRALYQDRRGYLWIGTQDGLNRYDGYTFTIYRYSADNPGSLPNNSIAGIVEDANGLLWVGTTGGGLASFDRARESFTRYRARKGDPKSLSDDAVSFLLAGRGGVLWIGTQFGGLNRFDPRTGEFLHYRHDPANPDSLASDDITTILEDRKGALWVGTRNAGLDRMDPATGRFTHFRHKAGDTASLNHDFVYGLYTDRQGRLWVGTDCGAAMIEDEATGRFQRFRHMSTQSRQGCDAGTWAFREEADGEMWVATNHGLERVTASGVHTVYHHDPYDVRTLSSDTVRHIFADRGGTLWFGTEGGLDRYSAAGRRFTTFRRGPSSRLSDNVIKGIYEEPNGTVWVGTDLGLNRYDPETGDFTSFQHRKDDPFSIPSNAVSAVQPGADGTLWISSMGGLSHFQPKTGRFRTYRHDPADPATLTPGRVGFIRPFEGGKILWVGTQRGLNRMDVTTGKVTRYTHDPSRPESLANNEVRAFVADRDGTYWIGTRHAGLEHLDPRTGVFTHYPHDASNPKSISGPAVYGLLIDKRGRLWAGTTAGLSLFDRESKTFTRFTEKDGLPNDTVYAVLEDASGYLWLSTNNGLARFDTDNRVFRSYNISHGLQDNEFNGGSAHYSPYSRMMYFGGINGYNRFDPETVRDSDYQPQVVITSFQKQGTAMPEVPEAGRVELSWRDSMFAAEFASLDYTAPDQNRYAYQLEGFDRDWQHSRSRRVAIYTNLDSGTYRFRVKGTNGDGVWSPKEASLVVTVIAPPWQRWWFVLGVALLAASMVYGAYRLRVEGFRKAQAAQEAFSRLLIESQEQERKRLAAELHDSLGQNLIVIRNQALMALAKPGDGEMAARKLEEISSAASEAIDEVREIARSLRPPQLERLGLTNALHSLVKRTEAASSIGFTTQIDPIDGLLSNEGEISLYRVVQEAVNNILKHSQASQASVLVERSDGSIAVRIDDNGQGFDPRAQDKRGFGLTGIAERARILNARHSLHSAPGQGTVIRLEIEL
jgi:signal transduction histidine kinase/ligand-binding sensor domain-containing protein